MDCSLPGFSVHGILQARTLEWVAISFSSAWKWKVKVKSLSRVWLLATPWTVAYQAPPSRDFPGKNTGVGCRFVFRGSSQPGTQTLVSCIAGRFFTIWATREAPKNVYTSIQKQCILKYECFKRMEVTPRVFKQFEKGNIEKFINTSKEGNSRRRKRKEREDEKDRW